MTIKKQLKRHLGKKATRRIYAIMPWAGTALAFAVGAVLQKRGVQGVLDDVRDIPSSIRETANRPPFSEAERSRDLVGTR